MADTMLNTLGFARELEGKGFTREQAEALAESLARFVFDRADGLASKADLSSLSERMATKEDISALATATKEDIAALRAATKEDIAALRATTKEDIAALATRVVTVETTMATKKDLAALATRVATVETTMVTKDGLAAVENRLLKSLIATVTLATAILATLITL